MPRQHDRSGGYYTHQPNNGVNKMRSFKCVSVNDNAKASAKGLFTVGKVYDFNMESYIHITLTGVMFGDVGAVRCDLNKYTEKEYALISRYTGEPLAVFHAA
ncbi:hypothetical protein VKUWNCZY_CDS0086 [Escherichia phage KS_A8]